jgi:hypothetical protein
MSVIERVAARLRIVFLRISRAGGDDAVRKAQFQRGPDEDGGAVQQATPSGAACLRAVSAIISGVPMLMGLISCPQGATRS